MPQDLQARFNNRPVDSPSADYLSAAEAADWLQIKRATLYTYVSRGLVRTAPDPEGRARRYLKEDLDKLKANKEARSGHAAVASGALRWGQPVLDSSITEIRPQGPHYRGQAATALARQHRPLHQVAALLWEQAQAPRPLWEPPAELGADPDAVAALLPEGSPRAAALPLALQIMASHDLHRFAAPPPLEQARGAHLILRLAAWCALPQGPQACLQALRAGLGHPTPTAAVLAAALGYQHPQATATLNQALVLCADHELNASAFAARVTASTGADLYACLASALATLSGPRHGGMCDRVDALLQEVKHTQSPHPGHSVVQARLARGEQVPGFGHPLYPEGDPRASVLLEITRGLPSTERTERLFEVIQATQRAGLGAPALDLGVVGLCEALEGRPGDAICVFAVGRAVGWIAHALEQRPRPHLLRPRARYQP